MRSPSQPTESDPYRNFNFRLTLEGRDVAGFTEVSGLPRQSSDATQSEALTLKHGVTFDTGFQEWASQLSGVGGGIERSTADARKDFVLERYDEKGQLAVSYRVYRCWVSSYTAMPDLDASANAVAIESLTLQHEGLQLIRSA